MTPQRVQLQRTKGWRKPEGCIVVARPSHWGNPFKIGSLDPRTGTPRTAEMAVADYRFLYEHLYAEENEAIARSELRDHDLACWCPLDQPCHADVLLELANR